MKLWPSPHERNTVVRNGYTIGEGRRMARDAERWMARNEAGFRAIYVYCKRLQDQGVKGRVRDLVSTFCVSHGIQVGEDPYRFDNSVWAGVARYLIYVDPSLENNPIRLKDSYIDCFGLIPVDYLKNWGCAHARPDGGIFSLGA